MSELSILKRLIQNNIGFIGACAIGGNMMAESNMQSNIAQRGLTKLTDEEYTNAADNGTINFIKDSVGYGLCQWTYHTRKQNLLNFAKSLGTSVGNEEMQIDFCIRELTQDYSNLLNYLKNTENLYEATKRICVEYERPAVNNIDMRYKYAQELYNKYKEKINNFEVQDNIDKETIENNINNQVVNGYTPESKYLAALLEKIGYDVYWEGIKNCILDFQQKNGLKVNGVCEELTWDKLFEVYNK